jgi:hypothetical protein
MEPGGMTFRASMRVAAIDLLRDYRDSVSLTLQVYEGRPATINPPTAFVEGIRENIAYVGPTLIQRTPSVDVIFLHGLFDSKDAAEAVDAFVDGFLAWVQPRFHAAGANTLIALTEVEDLPTYVPDWLPPERQRTYYGTRIALEGFAESA